MAITYLAGTPVEGDGGPLTPSNPTHASGDVLICFALSRNASDQEVSGWTEIIDPSIGTTLPYIGAWLKVASSSSETGPTVANGSNCCLAFVVAFTGVDNTTPVDVMGSLTEANSTTQTGASVDIVTSGAMGLLFSGMANDLTVSSHSMTNIIQEFNSTTRNDACIGVMEETYSSTGATGDETVTWNSSNNGAGILFALRPAGGGPAFTPYPYGMQHPGRTYQPLASSKLGGVLQ